MAGLNQALPQLKADIQTTKDQLLFSQGLLPWIEDIEKHLATNKPSGFAKAGNTYQAFKARLKHAKAFLSLAQLNIEEAREKTRQLSSMSDSIVMVPNKSDKEAQKPIKKATQHISLARKEILAIREHTNTADRRFAETLARELQFFELMEPPISHQIHLTEQQKQAPWRKTEHIVDLEKTQLEGVFHFQRNAAIEGNIDRLEEKRRRSEQPKDIPKQLEKQRPNSEQAEDISEQKKDIPKQLEDLCASTSLNQHQRELLHFLLCSTSIMNLNPIIDLLEMPIFENESYQMGKGDPHLVHVYVKDNEIHCDFCWTVCWVTSSSSEAHDSGMDARKDIMFLNETGQLISVKEDEFDKELLSRPLLLARASIVLQPDEKQAIVRTELSDMHIESYCHGLPFNPNFYTDHIKSRLHKMVTKEMPEISRMMEKEAQSYSVQPLQKAIEKFEHELRQYQSYPPDSEQVEQAAQELNTLKEKFENWRALLLQSDIEKIYQKLLPSTGKTEQDISFIEKKLQAIRLPHSFVPNTVLNKLAETLKAMQQEVSRLRNIQRTLAQFGDTISTDSARQDLVSSSSAHEKELVLPQTLQINVTSQLLPKASEALEQKRLALLKTLEEKRRLKEQREQQKEKSFFEKHWGKILGFSIALLIVGGILIAAPYLLPLIPAIGKVSAAVSTAFLWSGVGVGGASFISTIATLVKAWLNHRDTSPQDGMFITDKSFQTSPSIKTRSTEVVDSPSLDQSLSKPKTKRLDEKKSSDAELLSQSLSRSGVIKGSGDGKSAAQMERVQQEPEQSPKPQQ